MRGSRLIMSAVAGLGVLASVTPSARAVAVQPQGSSTYAFEAEAYDAVSNGGTIYWGKATDAGATGNASNNTLFQLNNGNTNGTSQPAGGSSTVTYNLTFSTAGTYNLYYRWRADGSVQTNGGQANGFFLPEDLSLSPTVIASSNGLTTSGTPSSLSYVVTRDAKTYTVSAGQQTTLTLGTREHNMYIDAFVLSTGSLGSLTAGGMHSAGAGDVAAFNTALAPEPAGVGLAVLASVSMLRRRR